MELIVAVQPLPHPYHQTREAQIGMIGVAIACAVWVILRIRLALKKRSKPVKPDAPPDST